MLRHTQKIREKYEEIQRKLFYMIPEKWDNLYLYASVIDRFGNLQTGELFFYYIPKGIIRRNPVNVYEIPAKFNIDEDEYMELVNNLYDTIKELREEFHKTDQNLWSNITISIENVRFKIDFNYDNLQTSSYTSYERHIIWRAKYLGIEPSNKKEKEILKRYFSENRIAEQNEEYTAGIYIKNIKNIVDFDTEEDYEEIQNVNYIATKDNKNSKNQILFKN